MKKIYYLLMVLIMSFLSIRHAKAQAQDVNIPNANFKAALVANADINTNGDDEIQVSEAAAYSEAIDVSNKGIIDLTGIEAFTNIDELRCSYNNLISLDVSENTRLFRLYCNNNQLSSLNLNTSLFQLDCSNNQLQGNALNVPLSVNPDLSYLVCTNNHLTDLNLNANTALFILECGDNRLSSLDVSANLSLYTIYCGYNLLSELKVSLNTNLQALRCDGNQLTSLEVSGNSNLIRLVCSSNQLTAINIQNGNNNNLDEFSATNNPSLTCIQVDDPSYMNATWSAGKDAGASFNTICTGCTVYTASLGINSGSPSAICPGGSTNLVVNITGASASTSYFDVTYNNGISSITSRYFISGPNASLLIPVTPSGTTTYSLIHLTDAYGCNASVSGSATITFVTNTTPSTPPPISGPANVCAYVGTGTATYSITPVPANVLKYRWTLPANVTTISGTADSSSITVSFATGFVSGSIIKVKAIGCSRNSADRSLKLYVTKPSIPGAITGPADVCNYIGQNVMYSITPVSGASSYLWTIPAGAAYVSGQGSANLILNFPTGYTTGTLAVKSVANCGSSSAKSLTITKRVPSSPGVISGPTNACPLIGTGNTATYSIAAMPSYSTSVLWTIPAGASIQSGQGTLSIAVSFDNTFNSGNISVQGINNCAVSIRNLSITKLLPATPGTITSTKTADCPLRVYTYTVASAANATSYLWTVPSNASISNGQGTTSITVSYNGLASGSRDSVKVRAVNNCAQSGLRKIRIILSACPPMPSFTERAAITESAVTKKVVLNAKEMDVNVFPNPSESDFKLQVLTSSNEKIHVRILDIVGKELRKFIIMPGEILRFGSELRHGSYIIEIRQGNNTATRKVLKF